jgi:formate dehydrogenase major subunit
MQLLLVRVRHDRQRSRRQARDDGGRLRPHRESWSALRQRHTSPNRLTTPRYRAPGSDHWEDISWDEAITRVAQRVRKTRDENWIATEMVDAPELLVDLAAGDRIGSAPRFVAQGDGNRAVPVNRTDAMGFMGGAQNTNEECYLFQKAARLLGMSYVEHQARL